MITLNGNPINVTRFPDNTTQVWKLDEKLLTGPATIRWNYSHEGELIELAQLKDLLNSYGVKDIYLQIDYLPFARQDKVVTNISTFALHSFSKLLNALEFPKINIMDPHSFKATELIKNSSAIYPINQLSQVLEETMSDLICYPDSGAVDKYKTMYAPLNRKFDFIYGNKVRDQETGHILSYELVGDGIRGMNILIVDDICDGGKTFEILTKDLLEAGAKEVNLFVTHGIFSKGLYPLFKAGIQHVYTKNGEAFIMFDGEIGYKNA